MEIPTELYYIGLSCITLISWDLMDFYIVLKRFDFLLIKPFWIHYGIRIFFSIVIMEIVFTLDSINMANRFLIAFVVPLLFPTILQNLVIEIGGGINISDAFSQFRDAIIERIQSRLRSKKVRIQTKLLDSTLSNDYLRKQCLFLSPTSEAFDNLEGILNQKDEDEKRVGYIRQVTSWGGLKHAEDLLKGKPPK